MNPMPLPKSLDPPEGGLEGLRARLDARRRRHHVAALLVVTVLALGWLGNPGDNARRPEPVPAFQHPIQRLAEAQPTEGVRILGGTALPVASSAPGTRIYLVDSLGPEGGAG